MFGIKRIYTFMLQRFLPLLLMTFFICLFILLMQFIWRYIDDLVGKGVPLSVIGELLFYAALSMVPMSLPLAVLLASLMTFGNLGEKFELTALKAAGISLFRIMRPLIVTMVLIAIGAFYFQNNVLPLAQTKMWTLLFSMRQKSPEVEIPVRVFYSQIPNINLLVQKKNPETGMLYDMLIYDMTNGMDNSRVILADSGKLNFTEDKTHLFIHLYNGQMYDNIRDNALGSSSKKYLPFRREVFTDKQIYLMFDANFNRIDEGAMRRQYIGKNITELRESIDSLGAIVDSIGAQYGRDMQRRMYVDVERFRTFGTDSGVRREVVPDVVMDRPLNVDSVFKEPSLSMYKSYVNQALNRARQMKDDVQFRATVITDQAKLMRRHGIEMYQKFTLSLACLIFFFIGAPLGAIIKKGGIGLPLVVSVLLFIFYYIFDNTGFKMAREGKLEVWQGVWLSSAVLLPLGVFLTYKAVGDSTVFNIDSYIAWFKRLIGRQEKRSLELRSVILDEVEIPVALQKVEAFAEALAQMKTRLKKRTIIDWLLRRPKLTQLNNQLNELIDYLSNSRDKKVVGLLNEYPFEITRRHFAEVVDVTTMLKDRLEADEGASPTPEADIDPNSTPTNSTDDAPAPQQPEI